MSDFDRIPSFYYFPILPLELQYLIWEATIEPQTITFGMPEVDPEAAHDQSLLQPSQSASPNDASNDSKSWFVCLNNPPVVLSVCTSSRDLVKRHYKSWNIPRRDGVDEILRWNPKLDIVYLDIDYSWLLLHFVRCFHSEDIWGDGIQNFAFPWTFWCSYMASRALSNLKFLQYSLDIQILLRQPSPLKQVFILAHKETFDFNVHYGKGRELIMQPDVLAIRQAFHEDWKQSPRVPKENPDVVPRISIACEHEQTWRGEDVTIPEIKKSDEDAVKAVEWVDFWFEEEDEWLSRMY